MNKKSISFIQVEELKNKCEGEEREYKIQKYRKLWWYLFTNKTVINESDFFF